MKVLLVMALNAPQVATFGIHGTSLAVSKEPKFDPILGFWIFRFQQLGKHPVFDGIASPAHGVAFAPGTPWVVFTFNEFARQSDPEVWERLPRNQTLSAPLRAELSR